MLYLNSNEKNFFETILLSHVTEFLLLFWVFTRYKKTTQLQLEYNKALETIAKKSKKLSVQNKFIGTLTHEMRNFVSR